MSRFRFTRGGLDHLTLAVISVLVCSQLRASETDNFYLPPDRDFADLGGFLEALHTHAIEAAVEEVNSRIERALNLKDLDARTRALARCHSPDPLAEEVAAGFGAAPLEGGRIAGVLGSRWARETFPGQTVRHGDIRLNFRGRTFIDVRALLMLAQSSTVKAYGTYFGTDKLVHFHQLGPQYFARYRTLLAEGFPPEAARQDLLEHFGRRALLAEGRGFGTFFTGIYSNADMASNDAGFRFLLNLTEPVLLKGQERPPLVVRCGVFWRLNDHVQMQSGWFQWFISDHWNEALNPNLYDASMRPHIRRILEERAGPIVEFYTRDGRPDDPAYFEQLARELSTYYGEPYGHSGQFENLMHLGNTCIPALRRNGADHHGLPPASP